jgi:hypothetical protein
VSAVEQSNDQECGTPCMPGKDDDLPTVVIDHANPAPRNVFGTSADSVYAFGRDFFLHKSDSCILTQDLVHMPVEIVTVRGPDALSPDRAQVCGNGKTSERGRCSCH